MKLSRRSDYINKLRKCVDMLWYWVYLTLAIGCEVAGTTCMKLSNGFTRLIPSAFAAVFYLLMMPFYTLAVKRINISVAYAIWSGVGTTAIALIGYFLFKEQMNTVKISAIALIIAGVVMLNLSGATN